METFPALSGVNTPPHSTTPAGGVPRKPMAAATRAALRVLLDATTGATDRRAQLEAVLTVWASTFPAVLRAFAKLPPPRR